MMRVKPPIEVVLIGSVTGAADVGRADSGRADAQLFSAERCQHFFSSLPLKLSLTKYKNANTIEE